MEFYNWLFDIFFASYVKIWFDVSGRIDVNFFHVSVPDIQVYSDYPSNSSYDQKGTTIMSDRYIRHTYQK